MGKWIKLRKLGGIFSAFRTNSLACGKLSKEAGMAPPIDDLLPGAISHRYRVLVCLFWENAIRYRLPGASGIYPIVPARRRSHTVRYTFQVPETWSVTVALVGRGGGTMELRQYDLYEIIPGGRPRWVGAAANLDHARTRLKDLAAASAGIDYFVREFRSGVVVAVASRPRTVARPQSVRHGAAAVPRAASPGGATRIVQTAQASRF